MIKNKVFVIISSSVVIVSLCCLVASLIISQGHEKKYPDDGAYITDGLVLLYDTQNNTGDGFSNSATVWKNLASDDGLYDGELIGFSDSSWQEQALTFDGMNDFVQTSMKQSSFGNNITIQATAAVDEAVKFRAIAGGHSEIPGLAFGQWQPAGFSFGVYNVGVFVSFPHEDIELGRNYNMAMSVSGGTDIQAYINSTSKKSGKTAYFESFSEETLKLGWAFPKRADGERFHLGSISSFLVYDRVLSDAEIDWNYQVDKNKYNLIGNNE